MGEHRIDPDVTCGTLPVHNVCISSFEMDVYEVTNAKYAECVNAGACSPPSSTDSRTRPEYYGNPDYADFPVIYMDWFRATEYCAWVGKRLPTSAEWEYAARGGLEGMEYPWGNVASESDANFCLSVFGCPDNDTVEVGSYPPNGYGLYDMAGNVWEWVDDWDDVINWNENPPYSEYYQYCFDQGTVYNPPGPTGGTLRMSRGGAYGAATNLGCRSHEPPAYASKSDGFRCARGGAYGP
jgi:formylglycine-generating enzyme required for sulfatase activity